MPILGETEGVTVYPEVTYSAIIMLITSLPYFIIQGADWHFGLTKTIDFDEYPVTGQPSYIRYASLAASILALTFLISYFVFQVKFGLSAESETALKPVILTVNSEKEEVLTRQEILRQFVMKKLLFTRMKGICTKKSTEVKDEENALMENNTEIIATVWHTQHKENDVEDIFEEESLTTKDKSEEENSVSKWKICLKSITYLLGGVLAITVFSDPMVGALAALTDRTFNKFTIYPCIKRGQYIPIPVFYLSFVVTPICSNASEVVSSLIFASKRKKVNSSMTYSQLYGAVTMNNTVCLAAFTALVYFNELQWHFSAEVTVIVVIEFCVGTIAIICGFKFNHTYLLSVGILVGTLYFISIFSVALLDKFGHWN